MCYTPFQRWLVFYFVLFLLGKQKDRDKWRSATAKAGPCGNQARHRGLNGKCSSWTQTRAYVECQSHRWSISPLCHHTGPYNLSFLKMSKWGWCCQVLGKTSPSHNNIPQRCWFCVLAAVGKKKKKKKGQGKSEVLPSTIDVTEWYGVAKWGNQAESTVKPFTKPPIPSEFKVLILGITWKPSLC